MAFDQIRKTIRATWTYYWTWPWHAARSTYQHLRAHLGWELALVAAIGLLGLVTGGGVGAAILALAAVALILFAVFLIDLVRTPTRRQETADRDKEQAERERDQVQARLDDLATPQFDCVGYLEAIEGGSMGVNDRFFKVYAYAWVEVTNMGPTSDFTARVSRVGGVPADWGDPYKVMQPAWEEKPSSTTTIERGGSRRLKLAMLNWDPRGMWFYTTQWGEQLPGNQLILGDGEIGEVSFVLEIVNIGADDRTLRKDGLFYIPLDATQTTFTLNDPPDQRA